ncbi:hypothetical protein MKZ38_005022 [Zalerion maritima]|uniref:Uncharacterized protein n=1 Tax=Zalerion maritima TaxID=339359 RepID=A0AAD5RLU6_9PEZI|nr:hypothetical protein MKZ38_005022 [Zalerion maritima]
MKSLLTPILAPSGVIAPTLATPVAIHYKEITIRHVDGAAAIGDLVAQVEEKMSSIIYEIAPLLTKLQGLIHDASDTFANSSQEEEGDGGLIGGLIGRIGKRQSDAAMETLFGLPNEVSGTVKEVIGKVGVILIQKRYKIK